MRAKGYSLNRRVPLSQDVAEQMLTNVFVSCEHELNSVPLRTLEEYSAYRKQKFVFQRLLIYLVLLVFVLLPVLFITGEITVRLIEGTHGNPAYIVEVKSPIPVSETTAVVGGRSVAVSRLDDGTFQISPSQNGAMTISVVLKNRQEIILTEDVTGVDDQPPYMVKSTYDSANFYVTVADAGSGVNFDGIKVTYTDDEPMEGWYVREDVSLIVVPYPSRNVTVVVPDNNANKLLLQLTPVTLASEDALPPEIRTVNFDSSYWYVYPEDSSSGINYAAVGVTDELGSNIAGWYVDEKGGFIAVPLSRTGTYLLSIPDNSGNVLSFRLLPLDAK